VSPVPGTILEQRLLIFAPVGRDAALVETMLRNEAVACFVCADLNCVSQEYERGAAAILIAEEALAGLDGRLPDLIARQPPWSDLPVLLLTRPGADSGTSRWALSALGNVTLLERPVRVAALSSAVRSALRARKRQYLARTHLIEREQADRRKDEFLATLAHELRNPLAPIRNSVNVLRLSQSSHPAREVWDMMDRQINHMVRLVDDLMEVSRITHGTIELRKEPLDLAGVIAAAIETTRPFIDSAKHELKVILPPRPVLVEGDSVRLAQVFSNLLNNAIKYTDPGGRISIAAGLENDLAVVTVSDSGIGIPAAALPNIFEMFVQVNAHDSRAQTGLGIGLTLVRRLIEMHGGSVEAHSAGAGKGSEFVVRLPLARENATGAQGAAATVRQVHGLPRVLVVDDNRDAGDSLGALLQMLGADVRVTHDGKGALDELAVFQPAAIFLDIGMPDMNGYDVAKVIRARPDAQDTVLIALTGWGQETDRRKSEASGFNHHLVKPADIGTLQAVLASLSR
jgi:signal transduction histidine kinase